jgi:hypothetical protein
MSWRDAMTWRRATRSDFPLAALWAWAASVTLAVAVGGWLPLLASMAPRCVLHQLTGIPCPTCGTTRAALALARGDLVAALMLNPLVSLVLVVGLVGGLLAPPWVAARGPLPRLPSPLPLSWRIGIGVALAADWTYLVLGA